MEQERSKKNTLKSVLQAIILAAGSFSYVFLMLHDITRHMSGLYNDAWLVPYFSYPAYIICVTIAIDYWIAGNHVRHRSYLLSAIFSVVILFFGGAYFMPGYVTHGGLRSLLSILFTAVIIFYGIRHVGKKRTKFPQSAGQGDVAGRKRVESRLCVVRIICLLSICCVLFENVQSSIMVAYGLIVGLNFGMNLSTFSQFPLTILSAILLARFVKAEFIPRDMDADRGAV